jgi:hypothetical protein
MRKISLPTTNTVVFSLTAKVAVGGGNLLADGSEAVSMGDIESKDWEELEVARENGSTLIWATICLEKRLNRVITNFFFGPLLAPDAKRQLFENEVIQSSSFTFQFKKKLIHQISDEIQTPNGKGRSKLQCGLNCIMGWRNAFAHGTLQLDAKKGVVLTYYSGQNNEQLLDEGFWQSVEQKFKECDRLVKLLEDVTSKGES